MMQWYKREEQFGIHKGRQQQWYLLVLTLPASQIIGKRH